MCDTLRTVLTTRLPSRRNGCRIASCIVPYPLRLLGHATDKQTKAPLYVPPCRRRRQPSASSLPASRWCKLAFSRASAAKRIDSLAADSFASSFIVILFRCLMYLLSFVSFTCRRSVPRCPGMSTSEASCSRLRDCGTRLPWQVIRRVIARLLHGHAQRGRTQYISLHFHRPFFRPWHGFFHQALHGGGQSLIFGEKNDGTSTIGQAQQSSGRGTSRRGTKMVCIGLFARQRTVAPLTSGAPRK